MTTPDLQHLKALALALRGLEWTGPTIEYSASALLYREIRTIEGDVVVGECGANDEEAAFIVAFNPATALALIAQLEAKPAAPAAAPLPRPWPNDLPFRALKVGEIGDHTPWQIVCPGGEVLEMNHNADDAVDEARAKWMVSTLNLATEDWSPFLKEDETPLQRLKREIADCHTIATMLSNERRAAAPLQQVEAIKTWQERLNCPLNKLGPAQCIEAEVRDLRTALANTRAAAPAAEGAKP